MKVMIKYFQFSDHFFDSGSSDSFFFNPASRPSPPKQVLKKNVFSYNLCWDALYQQFLEDQERDRLGLPLDLTNVRPPTDLEEAIHNFMIGPYGDGPEDDRDESEEDDEKGYRMTD